MNPLFLVSSAIHTKHGIYSAEQRLDQTIGTLESIKKHAPDARILLVESSAKQSITDEENDKLKPYLEGILNFNHDNQVKEIYEIAGDNWDIAKNLTELTVYGKALNFVLREQPYLLEDVSRVFKLSGRYTLNNSFDLSKHLDPSIIDSYAFAKRRPTTFLPSITGGLTHQVMSRCWSWPTHKTALVFFRFNTMIEDFVGSNHKGQYRDIEHLLLRYFDGPFMHELDEMGVEGQIGPNGNLVKD